MKGKSVKIDSDKCMEKLFVHLVSDLRLSHGQTYAAGPLADFVQGGICALRKYKFPSRSTASPSIFKSDYQLEALFKRYRFKHDMYSDEELNSMAWEKFQATQERLAKLRLDGPLVHSVLQEARRIAKNILGAYDLEEHMSKCRFGKRACVGTSYADSYLDEKLARPLTGSSVHIKWFKSYLDSDKLLSDCILELQKKKEPEYKVCTELTMTLVPKSFKARRSIMPDTLLGSFYTNGLGRMMADKLRDIGLDITRLQKRHGILAKQASRHRKYVTADLSAASDSISLELLRRVLPLPWFRVVTAGRIPTIRYGEDSIRMQTVLTMGLGQTFPLQTLIFYCLIMALGNLSGTPTFVSVYGDDLIYSRKLHSYVSVIFPKLGLVLNEEKTYAEDYFRESCGSDYFRGVDVRPFSPEGEHQMFNRLQYGCFIYKILNGIGRRWPSTAIPNTINFLLCELILHTGEVIIVPPDFPDTAGYKQEAYDEGYFVLPLEPCEKYHCYYVTYLHTVSGYRRPRSQRCYLWEKLRQMSSRESEVVDPYASESDSPVLKWREDKGGKLVGYVVSKKQPKKLVAVVPEKRTTGVNYARSTTTVFGTYRDCGAAATQQTEWRAIGRHPLMGVRRGRRGHIVERLYVES